MAGNFNPSLGLSQVGSQFQGPPLPPRTNLARSLSAGNLGAQSAAKPAWYEGLSKTRKPQSKLSKIPSDFYGTKVNAIGQIRPGQTTKVKGLPKRTFLNAYPVQVGKANTGHYFGQRPEFEGYPGHFGNEYFLDPRVAPKWNANNTLNRPFVQTDNTNPGYGYSNQPGINNQLTRRFLTYRQAGKRPTNLRDASMTGRGHTAKSAEAGSQAWNLGLQSRAAQRAPLQFGPRRGTEGQLNFGRIPKTASKAVQYAIADALDMFVTMNPQCANAKGGVAEFVSLVQNLDNKGFGKAMSVNDLMHVLGLAKARNQKFKIPSSGTSRGAAGAFSPTTFGVRNQTTADALPSYLWQVATLNCKQIDDLNLAIRQILTDPAFGIDLQVGSVPTREDFLRLSQEYSRQNLSPAERSAQDAAVAAFMSTHKQGGAQYEPELRVLLNLVDQYVSNAGSAHQLIDELAVLGIRGAIPTGTIGGKARWAQGAFSPATLGVTERTEQQIRISTAWNLAQLHLNRLGDWINPAIYALIKLHTNRAPTGAASASAIANQAIPQIASQIQAASQKA